MANIFKNPEAFGLLLFSPLSEKISEERTGPVEVRPADIF